MDTVYDGGVKLLSIMTLFISPVRTTSCSLSHPEPETDYVRRRLSHDFLRRGRAVQVPRVLGSQQGRILWQEASPVLLGLFPPPRRSRGYVSSSLSEDLCSSRTLSFSPTPRSLRTSPGLRGTHVLSE